MGATRTRPSPASTQHPAFVTSRMPNSAIARRTGAPPSVMSWLPGTANTPLVVRGDEFRQVLSRAFGPRAIRSTLFDVRRTGATFTFSGRGYGHGVGLCQAGALARLRAGATPSDVVGYYYPGTALERAGRLRAQGSGLRQERWTNYSKILLEP